MKVFSSTGTLVVLLFTSIVASGSSNSSSSSNDSGTPTSVAFTTAINSGGGGDNDRQQLRSVASSSSSLSYDIEPDDADPYHEDKEDEGRRIVINDNDIVAVSSFLVIEISGPHIQDDIPLPRLMQDTDTTSTSTHATTLAGSSLSYKDRANFQFLFQEAFDTIHGDTDGLYLSGERIDGFRYYTDDDDDDTDNNDVGVASIAAASSSNSSSIDSSSFVQGKKKRKKKKNRRRPNYTGPKWDIYLYADMSGMCKWCPDDDAFMMIDEAIMESAPATSTSTSSFVSSSYKSSASVSSSFLRSRTTKNDLDARDIHNPTRRQATAVEEHDDDDTTAVAEYLFTEASLNAIADEFCRRLMVDRDPDPDADDEDDANTKTLCDIDVLIETEYYAALAAIHNTHNHDTNDDGDDASVSASVSATDTRLKGYHYHQDTTMTVPSSSSQLSSESSASSSIITFPYYFTGGNMDDNSTNKEDEEETKIKMMTSNELTGTIIGTGRLKVTLNGITMHDNHRRANHHDGDSGSVASSSCDVWHTNDIFDVGTSIRNGFNYIHGNVDDVYDAGQTIDTIRCVRNHSRDGEKAADTIAPTMSSTNAAEVVDTTTSASSFFAATTANSNTTTVDETATDDEEIAVDTTSSFRRKKKYYHYKKNRPNRYDWGNRYEIYLRMDLSGRCKWCPDDDATMTMMTTSGVASIFSEASLRDIADTICDDLIRYANPNFHHTIDCEIEYLSEQEYQQALLLSSASSTTAEAVTATAIHRDEGVEDVDGKEDAADSTEPSTTNDNIYDAFFSAVATTNA